MTDTTTDDSSEHSGTDWPAWLPAPEESLGEVTLTVECDRETYDRVREVYRRAVDAGGAEAFDTIAINHCDTEVRIVVDGEEVDPTAPDFGAE